jgi:hypothetical protein
VPLDTAHSMQRSDSMPHTQHNSMTPQQAEHAPLLRTRSCHVMPQPCADCHLAPFLYTCRWRYRASTCAHAQDAAGRMFREHQDSKSWYSGAVAVVNHIHWYLPAPGGHRNIPHEVTPARSEGRQSSDQASRALMDIQGIPGAIQGIDGYPVTTLEKDHCAHRPADVAGQGTQPGDPDNPPGHPGPRPSSAAVEGPSCSCLSRQGQTLTCHSAAHSHVCVRVCLH